MARRDLCALLERKGFLPRHVAEVGVYHPATSNILPYVRQGLRCTLVEPDPRSIAAIKEHFAGLPNVTLHEVAVFDRGGRIELTQRQASTFVSELSASPAIVNDGYQDRAEDRFTVEARTFDQLDDGSIDLLSVDVEGSEWFVVKHMVSRPAVLSLETHGGAYRNPHLGEILRWTRSEGYQVLAKTLADTVFVRPGVVPVTLGDRARLAAMELRLAIRRARKQLRLRLRS
jgi:FkbM family methyltransferase